MAQTKEEKAAYRRAYYQKNKELVSQRARNWEKSNPDKHLASLKKWKLENKEKVKEYNKVCDARNPERIKEKARKQVDLLTDSYISHKLGMKVKDCPPGLINLKREFMTVKRLSRQIKQTTKAHNETSTNIS